MSISGIRNPRSTASTLTFKTYIYDSNGDGQYSYDTGANLAVSSVSDFTDISISRGSTINSAVTTYTFTITLSNVIESSDYYQIVFPNEMIVDSVANQCVGVTNLATSLTCSVTGQNVYLKITLEDGVTQLPTVAGDTTTQIVFNISDISNPPSLDESSTFEFYVTTQNRINEINERTTGVTITNTEAGTLTDASASPDDSSLGATTNYLISFLPTTYIYQDTMIKVAIPSQITVSDSTAITCTEILVIESTLSCTYDSSTHTVTVSDGFATEATYIQSQVEFKISSLTNPASATTTDSFTIQTLTSSLVLYDEISNDLVYSKSCNTPCDTCTTDLDLCTSCDTTSSFAYLSDST